MAKKSIKDFVASQVGINLEVPLAKSEAKPPIVPARQISSPKAVTPEIPSEDTAPKKKMGRPSTGRRVNASIYISQELKDKLVDIQFHRRINSFNDLINDILQEYVERYSFRS